MAIDQTPSTSPTESAPGPVIENELPAYRAISSSAVLSLILALASIFCFTSLWFLLVVAAAVLSGWYSIRKINQFPEVWTGANYAKIGIGVSLLFGLCAVSHVVSEDFLIELDARQFSNLYIDVIKNEPMSLALWYQQSPELRKTKSPDEIIDELKKAKSPVSPDPYREKTYSLQLMKDRLKAPGETIRFSKVETKAIDGLTVYANALIELDGPGSAGTPPEQFALFQMVKRPGASRLDWIVQDVKFPYTPKSAVATIQKADDGHGHGGGH